MAPMEGNMTRDGREVVVEQYILERLVKPRYNGDNILRYRSRWYAYDS